MNIKKFDNFLILIIISLIILNIINSYYGGVVLQENRGLPPLYDDLIQALIINIILIVILLNKKLYFFSYIYLAISLVIGFIDSSQFGTNNPLYWLHRGDFQAFIGISIWILELTFSILGLGVWLLLNFRHRKFQLH